MRQQHDVAHRAQFIRHVGLVGEHVEPGGEDRAGFQRRDQCRLVDHRTARERDRAVAAVDADRAALGARFVDAQAALIAIAREIRQRHLAVGIEHGVGVKAIVAGVERLDLVGNVEVDRAVGPGLQEGADRVGLAAQSVAMQVVGGLVEQPVQRERHQDRRDGDGHHVQNHDARDDGAEAEHGGEAG